MTTNLLNNLSNVLKKGPSETQKNPLAFEAQSAAEKSNRVLITCLSRVNHLIQYRCMRYAAMIFAVLVMSMANVGMAWGANGDVLFNQGFGSATEVAYSENTTRSYSTSSTLSGLVGTGDNLFQGAQCNNKTSCGIAINTTSGANSYTTAGTFQAYANNTSFKWALYKTTNFATTAPTAIKFEMDVTPKYIDNKQALAVVVGSGFSVGTSKPAWTAGYTGFNIITNSTKTGKIYIGKVGGTTSLQETTGMTSGTNYHITWVINATGEDLTYTGPDSKSYTLATAKWDMWVGTTRIISGQDRTKTGSSDFSGTTMQNLYIGNDVSGKHEVIIDNVKVTDLTPDPCDAADLTASNITSNGDQEAGTGITFSKVGSPASGDTWYWQTSATGTDKTYNATSPYTTATTAGSYTVYLRAFNTDCWGTAASMTNTIYPAPSAMIHNTFAVNDAWGSTIATQDKTNITGLNAMAAVGESVGSGSNKSGLTQKIPSQSSEEAGKYMSLSFNVASGKQLNVTSVVFDEQPVTGTGTFKVSISDNQGSTTKTQTIASDAAGSKHTLTLDGDIVGSFKGTVTVKVWAYGWGDGYRFGDYFYIHGTVTDAAACTAPNHVDVSGAWDRFGGETISLTATAYSSAGTESPIADANITGWQWQKWYDDKWNDISDGTDGGATISGATTKNLQISNCSRNNSGSYQCVVSTGATCSTASSSEQVKVFTLECYTGGTTVYNFTRDGENQAGSVEIDLAANTAYTFKFHVDNVYYGNNASINEDITNYVFCNSDNGGNCAVNFTVNSGLGGTFTFSMEYSTGGNSSVLGEPELSVTYPRKRIYLDPGVWKTPSDGEKFAYNYYRDGGSGGWTDFLTEDDCGMYADIPQWNGVILIPARLKNTTVSPGSWDDRWNQTNNITVTSNDYVTITGWNASDFTYTTYSTPTYTISYNAGTGGSGSKSNETKTCGVDFTLPNSAVFTRTGYTQTGWTTTDGGAQEYALGGTYTTNEDKTFYPVWTVNNYDLTWNLDGGTTTSAGTGIGSGVSSNTTTSQAFGTALSAPTVTKTGYNFSAWSPTVAGTMPAANTTYTATWTVKTTTITIDANTANHGSTTPGTVTATWGSALPSFTAAAGESGWNLTGYFTEATSGTKVINANGTLVASTDYADGSGNWKYETATLTLFPQYEEEVSCTGDPTALVSGTLYQVSDMASACLGEIISTGQYFYGLSSNGKFYINGTTNSNNASTGTVEIKTASNTIDKIEFTGIAWFKGAGTNTCRSIKFVVPSAGTLTIYGKTSSSKGNVVIKTESSGNTTVIANSVNAYASGSTTVSAGTYYVLSDGESAAIVGLKFVESACSAPAAPTISGTTSYTAGQTITLTASHDGSNHDGSTTYTWYKGADWATARAASPVQAAATGSSGYTFTKASCVVGDAGTYWCEAANSTCTSHNSSGYAITVNCPSIGTPSTPTVEDLNATGAKFSWDKNGMVSGALAYQVSIIVTETEAVKVNWTSEGVTADFTGWTYTASGLTEGVGYTFKVRGWSNGCVGSESSVDFTPTTPITYTVTYDYQGATGGASPASASGASVTLPTPTKTSCTFQGWYASNGTKIGDGGDTYNPMANITVYALWRADCAGGGGGGGGTLFSQNFSGSGSLTYTQDVGYTKNSGLTGIVGNAANLFTSITTSNKNTTGIAINHATGGNSVNATGIFQAYFNNTSGYWSVIRTNDFAATAPTAVKMSMDFYLDQLGSSSSAVMVNFAIGDGFSESLKSSSAESTSKIHSGWGITVESSMKMCAYDTYGTKIYNTALSDKTWYSVTWVINNTGSDLTYDDPDGSGTTTLANDKFDIWLKTQAQAASNYTKVVSARDAITASKALQELYIGHASGKKHEFRMDNIVVTDLTPSGGDCYYVTYNGNGATGGFTKDETAYALNANPTVASNSFTKTGYTFTGWNTAPGGGGTAYAAGGTISNISADVTLYAQWSADATTYELAWNTNGGSDLVCTGTCTSGDLAYGTTIVAPTDPTKSNYTFDGWNTANDGSGSAAAATMPAENVTYYAAWKQTVTLNTGSQGSEANKTPYVYLNGTELSDDAVHSAAGYTLTGYYTETSGGTKVLNADGSLVSDVSGYTSNTGKWNRTGTAPTLYAQWRASAGSTCYEWNATEDAAESGTNVAHNGLYLTATSTTSHQLNSSDATAYTCFDVSKASKVLTGNLNGLEIASVKFAASTSDADNNTFIIAFCSSTTFSTDNIIQVGGYDCTVKDVNKYDAAKTEFTVTAPSGTKSFALGRNLGSGITTSATLENSGSRYLYYIKACTASGGTHTISYNAGGGSGTMTSDASIADDGSKTIKTNTFTAPTNFTFAGWVANVDVTIDGNTITAGTLIANGATITNIISDIALTAKWSQTITLDKNSSNHGTGDNGSATVYYNATELASITHTTPASGYKLKGYYTAATDGTKVLNSDGTYAATAVTGYITDGKWTQNTTSTPTLHAQYELAGGIVTNTLKVGANKWGSSISTSEPTHIRSLNALAAVGGLTIEDANGTTVDGTGLTCKIEASGATTKTDAEYLQLSFTIDPGYKLNVTGLGIKVRSVSKAGKYHVELAGTTGSLSPSDETVGSGSIATIFDDAYDQDFTGTVTLKLWAYGKDGSNLMSEYRLANPVTIYGTLVETCTMPSYSSVTYTKTEYTVSETSSAITVTSPADVTSYQWKYSATNDRTSGTNADAVGTGATTVSFTPSTSVAHEKRYYWCELTNACGTIKTEAVGVTVSTSKSAATVTWSNPGTVNYGGGGYTLRATVNETAWDGTAANLTITAPAGINIYGVTSGTDGSSKKYVEVTFDVQTSFDRTTYAENIPFTVSHAATTNYNAISDEHNVAYSACAGAGEGSSYNIRVRKAYTKGGPGNNYYYWDNTDGWISSPNPQSSINSAKASSTMATVFDSVSNTNAEAVYVRTYHNNINKVRIYADFRANNMTVTNVYKHNDFYTANSKYAVSYTAEYNGDDSNENLGTAAQGYVDIILDEMMSENDILLVKFNTSRVRPLGAVITEGSAGSLNTHLQWSGSLADGATVAKNTTDAYFTYSASKITENTNTLGTITYSSTNTSVATVDATGKVALVAAGSTTIKATLAASGCYKKAEISYTLNVTEVACAIAAGTLTLTSGSESKCSGDNVTLTLTGFESGATLQWKDGDTNLSDGGDYTITSTATTSTLTTAKAGTYSVMVTKDCSVRSNRITISNKSTSVSAERIVKNWYIKKGRLTPPIELWSLSEGTHLSSVAWSPANATGLSGEDLFFEQDGKVYMQGTAPTADNSTGSDITYTLTLTVKDECNSTTTLSTSDKQIILYHQKNTDKHVLAFVVTGTEKGGFTEGVPSNQTTEVDLYKAIAAEFDVLATNVYSTDDEQAIKEYYSQFDILCVTDYPNTNKTGVNKESYVNALGSLIDIRPILTMEAFVAKWSNWAEKGISGTPKSPSPKQYAMDLQCKDHEIFDGTSFETVGSGEDEMFRVTMANSTSYPSDPALQGFTFDATMVADGLLPLGQIYNGESETLQVGIERQNEMAARLMVLGINSVAMERLTEDGQRVVINALKYLMKKNEEDIADCSVSFVGGAEGEGESTNWNNDANWSTGKKPDKTTREIRILAPVIITDAQNIHALAPIKIASSGTYNDGADAAMGKITIAAGGALRVDGKVLGVKAPAYSKPKATNYGDILIKSSSEKGNGTLIFVNDEGSTKAVVEMYCKSQNSVGDWSWQYVAVPFNDNSSAYRNYYGSWLYRWAADNSGWEVVPNQGAVYPWIGYCLTQETAKHYVMDGTLVETTEKEFTLGTGMDMVIGNSWTAPIQVKQLTNEDFGGLTKNIYLFNTGLDVNCSGTLNPVGTDGDARYAAGTYVVVPIHSSPYTGDSLISSLQAFTITNSSGSDATLTLNYDKHVRPTRNTDKVNAGPMHAPRRNTAQQEGPAVLKIWASGSNYDDRLVLLEGEGFSTGYDDGWDGEKIMIYGAAPEVYSVMQSGKESVTATPDMEGTLIGFRAGEDSEYTFQFNYNDEDDELYLLDTDTKIYTLIRTGNSYSFTTSDKAEHNRFILTRNAPQIATGNQNVTEDVKAMKFIKDDKMYILLNGVLYDATGKHINSK